MNNMSQNEGNFKNALIVRTFNEVNIGQRPEDGYLNATAMCKAAGKKWNNYWRNDGVQEFLEALAASLKMPVARIRVTEQNQCLTYVQQGGCPEEQGTWVHPQVAYHLAQWCSPAFAVQVTEWIADIREYGFTTTKGVKAEIGDDRRIKTIDPMKRAKEIRLQLKDAQRFALAAGLEGNQAVIAASRWTKALTGFDPMEALGITTEMKSPINERDTTARDLGEPLGISAIKANKLLEAGGYVVRLGGEWEPTEKGKSFGGHLVDRVRSNGTGSAQQLVWPSSMIETLRDLLRRTA